MIFSVQQQVLLKVNDFFLCRFIRKCIKECSLLAQKYQQNRTSVTDLVEAKK